MLFILFAVSSALFLARPARAYDWTYRSMAGETCTCIEAEPIRPRVFVGTVEGFHYLEQDSGIWTNRDWDGWIGRTVWSIQWHPAMENRVITGRENAFFKGYIEVSDDLGASETLVYNSNGGGVQDLATDGIRFYACTWPDVAPGEFLRSDNDGDSWTLLGGHGHYAMTSIAFNLGGTLFLAGDNRVMRSFDEGQSWDFVGGGLPAGELVYDIESGYDGGDIAPELGLFAGTETGVYFAEVANDWQEVLDVGARNLVTYGGAYLLRPDFVAAVTVNGRVMVSSYGGNWTDETGNLPGLPVDIAYSPYDDGLYVCTQSNGVYSVLDVITAAEETPAAASPRLSAWPNPFNPKTTLSFNLPESGRVRLDVFDVDGRHVASLLDAEMRAGAHELDWEAAGLAGGVYLARLAGDWGMESFRLVLLK